MMVELLIGKMQEVGWVMTIAWTFLGLMICGMAGIFILVIANDVFEAIRTLHEKIQQKKEQHG